jgi:hypothetical protein
VVIAEEREVGHDHRGIGARFAVTTAAASSPSAIGAASSVASKLGSTRSFGTVPTLSPRLSRQGTAWKRRRKRHIRVRTSKGDAAQRAVAA